MKCTNSFLEKNFGSLDNQKDVTNSHIFAFYGNFEHKKHVS